VGLAFGGAGATARRDAAPACRVSLHRRPAQLRRHHLRQINCKECQRMRLIPLALWTASGIQFAIAAANVALPRKLKYRENLSKVSPIVRQIFITHSFYVVGIVLLFAVLTLFFPSDLASGAGLGRFLAASISAFWFFRVPVQLFYYGRELRKQNPVAHWAFASSALYLSVVYALAAIGAKG
jgi:hypothetical protein